MNMDLPGPIYFSSPEESVIPVLMLEQWVGSVADPEGVEVGPLLSL